MSVGFEWDSRLEQHRADPFFIKQLVFKKQNTLMQLRRRQGIPVTVVPTYELC
jgi:hypothetical protein